MTARVDKKTRTIRKLVQALKDIVQWGDGKGDAEWRYVRAQIEELIDNSKKYLPTEEPKDESDRRDCRRA